MSQFEVPAEAAKKSDAQEMLDREIERMRKSTIFFFLFTVAVWSFFALMLPTGTPEGPPILADISRGADEIGAVVFSVLGLIASGFFMSSLLTYIELLFKRHSASRE